MIFCVFLDFCAVSVYTDMIFWPKVKVVIRCVKLGAQLYFTFVTKLFLFYKQALHHFSHSALLTDSALINYCELLMMHCDLSAFYF